MTWSGKLILYVHTYYSRFLFWKPGSSISNIVGNIQGLLHLYLDPAINILFKASVRVYIATNLFYFPGVFDSMTSG